MDRVIEIASFLRARGRLGALVLDHFNGDLGQAKEALDDNYRGVFTQLADCLQDLTEEATTIPENLRPYIYYEAMARDAELNGDIFIVETAHDEVHVFWSR